MDVQGILQLRSAKHKQKTFDEHGPSFSLAEEHNAKNFDTTYNFNRSIQLHTTAPSIFLRDVIADTS